MMAQGYSQNSQGCFAQTEQQNQNIQGGLSGLAGCRSQEYTISDLHAKQQCNGGIDKPVDPSIGGTLEAALGFMAQAEQELGRLHDKLTGPRVEGECLPPTGGSVESQARELSTRLACLVGQIRTINGKV